MPAYELVMGLETHVRVKSETKMFCSCRNATELADDANEHTCPFCMGFPGALPRLSEAVVDLGVRAGHAMKCAINPESIFDRKSYFYPDLPAGYQITQLFTPIAVDGTIDAFVGDKLKTFRIERMHLETDAGKLVHAGSKSLIDYNRAGSPLMEIVTKPDFRTREEVLAYLEELQKLLRFAGASDADMEKGQLRCDVNISIRKPGEDVLNNRVELKNLNSFSAIGRAIEHEYRRQVEIVESGGTVGQETRGWDDEKGTSSPQRSKEDAMDYRYFPEPDLPPLVLSTEYIEVRKLDDRPIDRRIRYLSEYRLLPDDARILSRDRETSDYYDELVRLSGDAKKSCSYLTTVLFALMDASESSVTLATLRFVPEELARVIAMVTANELSSTNSKAVVETLFTEGGKADEIVDRLGLRQNNDTSALEAVVDRVIAENAEQVAEYRAGNERVFGFLVGQCMKASAGQGNPKIFNELLKAKL
ncbi:MAG TPA: Asp-tRNA(Asn)/Glu-tRNA(Gln) amidotransferase subunit GatB [bacterium]|nr:Asp-tRNA(Asn)/Glu-tRNA(Gln) amidotransferase subunit GatB [bacterium]